MSADRRRREQVEAPSQMNENFLWEPSILKRVSSHSKRDGEAIPDDLIEKLLKSRRLGQGLFNLRQIFFAKVSERVWAGLGSSLPFKRR